MRPTSKLLVLLGSLLACDATIGSTDEVGDGDTGEAGDGGSSFEPCSAAAPCPDGQSCFNGSCALGCTDNGDCAGDQYCDSDSQLCQTQTVATCSDDGDCGQGQICVNQFCSTPPVDSDCQPGALTMDGCPSDAICLQDPDPDVEGQACYTMPACAADHTCPVGVYGSLCNVDYLFDKDEICLIGVCDTIANCPADWFCVRESDNDPLGLCSGGGFGEPCSKPEHCLSGMCFIPIPGLLGFCQG